MRDRYLPGTFRGERVSFATSATLANADAGNTRARIRTNARIFVERRDLLCCIVFSFSSLSFPWWSLGSSDGAAGPFPPPAANCIGRPQIRRHASVHRIVESSLTRLYGFVNLYRHMWHRRKIFVCFVQCAVMFSSHAFRYSYCELSDSRPCVPQAAAAIWTSLRICIKKYGFFPEKPGYPEEMQAFLRISRHACSFL